MLNSFAVASCISETLAPTPKEHPKSSFSKIAIRDDGGDEIVFGIVSVMEIIAAAVPPPPSLPNAMIEAVSLPYAGIFCLI